MAIQSLVPSCSPAAASNSSAPVNTLIADHSLLVADLLSVTCCAWRQLGLELSLQLAAVPAAFDDDCGVASRKHQRGDRVVENGTAEQAPGQRRIGHSKTAHHAANHRCQRRDPTEPQQR